MSTSYSKSVPTARKSTGYSKAAPIGRTSLHAPREAGSTGRPKVDPQFSTLSKGVTRASGGARPHAKRVGYSCGGY